MIESRMALHWGGPFLGRNRPFGERERAKRKQCNIMNGCHLVLGRSRIDRWYITTFERPNRTDQLAFNRHDSSRGPRRKRFLSSTITTASPIFLFSRSVKRPSEQHNNNNKKTGIKREELSHMRLCFLCWLSSSIRAKEFRSSKLTAINGTDWNLTDGATRN